MLPDPAEIEPNESYQIAPERLRTERLPWPGLKVLPCSEETGTQLLEQGAGGVWSDDAGLTFFNADVELWTLDERTASPVLSCKPAKRLGPFISLTGRREGDATEVWVGTLNSIARLRDGVWENHPLPDWMLAQSGTDVGGEVRDLEVLHGRIFALTPTQLGVYDPANDTWRELLIPPDLDREYGLHGDGQYLWGVAGTVLYMLDTRGVQAVADLVQLDMVDYYAGLETVGEVLQEGESQLGPLGVIGADEQGVWVAQVSENPIIWRYNPDGTFPRIVAGNGGGARLDEQSQGWPPSRAYAVLGGMGGSPLAVHTVKVGGNRPPELWCDSMMMEFPCTIQRLISVLTVDEPLASFSDPYFEYSFCAAIFGMPWMMCAVYDGPSPWQAWRGQNKLWVPRPPMRVSW